MCLESEDFNNVRMIISFQTLIALIGVLIQCELYKKWGWDVKGKRHFKTPWGEFDLWSQAKIPAA